MHRKKIYQQFEKYRAEHAGEAPYLEDSDPNATLYGKDQVSIDWENKRIKLSGGNWIEAENVIPKTRLSWVALWALEDGFHILFAEDGSRSSDEAKDHLPTQNGVITAVPYGYCPL